MSRLSATEAESFLHTLLTFFRSKFSYFDDVYVHGIRVSGFGGIGEGLVGLMSGFRVSLGNFIGAFPLGLEGNGLFIPVLDGSRDSVHGHDATHEGGRDASKEISDEDILVGNACERGVVLKVGDVLNEGWGIGVVFPFGHAFGGEPGDSSAGGVVVLEHGFELCDKVGEGSHGYGGSRDGVLPECGCPSEGRPFGRVGESEGNHLVIGVIDFVVDKEVEAYCIQPLGGLVIGSIKGFQCSDTEFSRF